MIQHIPAVRAAMAAALLMSVANGGVATSSEVTRRAAVAASRADSLGIRDLLDVNTAAIGDLSPDGRWLVVTLTSRRDGLGIDFTRDGDPTYLRGSAGSVLVVDTRSMARRSIWPGKKSVRTMSWSPDGTRLAMLVIENDALQPTIWDRATGKLSVAKLPAGQYVAENSELRWTTDGTQLAFATHTDAWKKEARDRFADITRAPIVALDGKDDFLEWDAMNRMAATRAIVSWDPATNAVATVLGERRIGAWTLSKDGSAITAQEDITKKTDYDVIGGREWKLVTQSRGGDAKTLFPSLKGIQIQWADDGQRFVTGRDGRVLVGSIADTVSRLILGPAVTRGAAPAAPADTTAAARAQRGKERFTPVRWSPAGDVILASNSEGLWIVDVASGSKDMILATPDSNSVAPRTQFNTWSQDGRYLYFTVASRTKWERGISRYDRQTKQLKELVKDSRLYSNLRVSKDGSTTVLGIASGNHVPDLYVGDGALGGLTRAVETNPQLPANAVAKTELISYLDADGRNRYGVLHYPTNYVKGTRYPTVFIIYEDFFDDSWDAVANLLSAHGYAVVKPSVGFEIGYPGEAWVKGVTAAANAVIAMGVADSARLGVHGTSYGGYATNLLITQTNRFKAAINMSGKVDIISFYTDSPRLGVRNIHAAEKSQDRIGATLWQQPQKYVQHSAVMFADRITTPLLMLTGGQDHNVPELNTREMYYALRRLGKTVTWVSYTNGGHGVPSTTERDFMDYHQRILDWYAKYLGEKKPAAASNNERR